MSCLLKSLEKNKYRVVVEGPKNIFQTNDLEKALMVFNYYNIHGEIPDLKNIDDRLLDGSGKEGEHYVMLLEMYNIIEIKGTPKFNF